MASSPIEIASAAPYHDVLRTHGDRRIRDRDRECSSKKRFVVKKNINELVRDHLHNCWGEKSSHGFGLDESKRGETRILDRWAAHQAKEMISTLERQTHQAELLALSNSQSVSERASTFLRETSPSSPSDSSEVPNLRASSLVQMWKEFEAEATTPRGCQNANSNARYKTLNSTVSNVTENASIGESPVGSERDFRFDTFMEWDPEQIPPSSDQQQHLIPSFQRQTSDASEGNKVADIVKRLTSAGKTCNEIDQEQPEPPTSSSSVNVPHLVEPMDFKINRKRLRLRGRQATKDLFMQMEHERRLELSKLAERRSVAQFPQRGRIQALIRLKFLQREAMVQNQQRPASTSSELNQLHGKSTIFRLREKFNTRDKHIDAAVHNLNEDRLQQNSQTVIQDSGHEDNLETHTRSLNAALDSCNVPILNEDRFQTDAQLLDATKDDTGLFDHLTSQDAYSNSITTFEDNGRTVTTVDNSTSDSSGQAEHHSDPSTSKKHTPTSICMENLGNNESTSSHGWQGVIITEEELVLDAMDRWEMLNAEQPESNTLDRQVEPGDGGSWFNNNASCPPTDWECTRQTWYNENGHSDNEEIDGLLHKRTVSNLLASSFRERMDRLLLSRLKKHPEIFGNAEEEEEFIGHPYQEMSDDPDQVPIQPSNSRPWNQRYQDQETSDSDRAAYTSLGTPQPFSSDSHHFSPFTNHQSLEMEFLYELKGHVERLQYEMSEMRETLKSCMGMQMMLQNSISQEVAAAVCRSMNAIRGDVAVAQTSNTTPKKRLNCCICCSTQVDSFLYRCGHMCTCFKCAQELQCSSSRCPICRAPILDVVRAYPDP